MLKFLFLGVYVRQQSHNWVKQKAPLAAAQCLRKRYRTGIASLITTRRHSAELMGDSVVTDTISKQQNNCWGGNLWIKSLGNFEFFRFRSCLSDLPLLAVTNHTLINFWIGKACQMLLLLSLNTLWLYNVEKSPRHIYVVPITLLSIVEYIWIIN